jgi:hypothetical protein
LERADEVAPAWRQRWDSLKLFTPIAARIAQHQPGRHPALSNEVDRTSTLSIILLS